MDDYYKKVTAFLEEYLNFKKPDCYTTDGALSLVYIKYGIDMLILKKVFISKKDIKQQALKDYRIILSDDLFKEAQKR